MKIFLSHNWKDKEVVGLIAEKLAEIIGKENVFYDSWSIQPGDGIIDKMNSGLSEMNIFFFFVSRNSLESNMVKLEWQNALYKASNGQCKFVPVKIDDCIMPAVLLQNLYIDFYNYGFDVGISQVIDVISGKNTFRGSSKEFSNLIAYISEAEGKTVTIEIQALHFQEPISNYGILIGNDLNDVVLKVTSDAFHINGGVKASFEDNGITYNLLYFEINRPTVPGFPIRVEIRPKNNVEIIFGCLYKRVKEKEFATIKTIERPNTENAKKENSFIENVN